MSTRTPRFDDLWHRLEHLQSELEALSEAARERFLDSADPYELGAGHAFERAAGQVGDLVVASDVKPTT